MSKNKVPKFTERLLKESVRRQRVVCLIIRFAIRASRILLSATARVSISGQKDSLFPEIPLREKGGEGEGEGEGEREAAKAAEGGGEAEGGREGSILSW